MSSKSNYLENEILDHIYGGGDYSRPDTVYFAAYAWTAPSDTGGGNEVTGGTYARVAVANNATNFPAAASGVKSNATAILWPVANPGWAVLVAVAVFDAPTGGNMLHWVGIPNTRIRRFRRFFLPIGGFSVTED